MTVYLLCGLPGSGKTTYAKFLEQNGATRLTLDEELFKIFGKNFPPERYADYESQTKNKLLEQIVKEMTTGKDVVLDWGFWKKHERDEIKSLVENNGGQTKLIYFKKNLEELNQRLKNRDLSENHIISPEMMAEFKIKFEEPKGEGEEIK